MTLVYTFTEIWAWQGREKAEEIAKQATGGVWRGTLGELLWLLGWRKQIHPDAGRKKKKEGGSEA